MSGEAFDISSDAAPEQHKQAVVRPFVGIHFQCCRVYSRIYVNSNRTAFVGHCPRCAKAVRLEIAPGGSDQRIFNAF
jgi:hypothetical protein